MNRYEQALRTACAVRSIPPEQIIVMYDWPHSSLCLMDRSSGNLDYIKQPEEIDRVVGAITGVEARKAVLQ